MTPEQFELVMGELRSLRVQLGDRVSPWRDAKGIAERLGVSPKTVQNLTGPGVADPIPFHRLTPGGEKRFQIEEVDEWLRLRRRGAN